MTCDRYIYNISSFIYDFSLNKGTWMAFFLVKFINLTNAESTVSQTIVTCPWFVGCAGGPTILGAVVYLISAH